MLEIDKIYCADCLTLMKDIPDKSIDLVITSPPYNLGGDFHTMVNGKRVNYGSYISFNDSMQEKDYQEWQLIVLSECYRILKNNGNIFYNHKNRLKDFQIITPYEWLLKSKFILRQEIVWDTTNEINQDNRRFIPCHEKLFWLSKEITHLDNSLRLQDCWVFRNKVCRKEYQHPATYPIEIVEQLINMLPEAEFIFDPFIGIGTTAIASVNLGKHYLGCDISQEYVDIANKRIADAIYAKDSQPELEFSLAGG